MKLQQILKILIIVFLITPTITTPTTIKQFGAVTFGTMASIVALKCFYEFFFYMNAATKSSEGGPFNGLLEIWVDDMGKKSTTFSDHKILKKQSTQWLMSGLVAAAIGASLLYYWKTAKNSV